MPQFRHKQRRSSSTTERVAANDSGDDTDGEDEDDYYMLLNVARDASQEQITAAYRHLSRLYHPDKHATDSTSRQHAELLFARVKLAYEVLQDAGRRAVYDQLGCEAARADTWQLVARDRTPAEIYERYRRLAREQEQRRLQRISNARGSITLFVDATDLLSSYDDQYNQLAHDDEDDDDDSVLVLSMPRISVSGLNCTQSVDTPLSARDTLVLGGQVGAHNGTGQGQVAVTWRRTCHSAGWWELEAGAGSGLLLSARAMRQLSRRCHMTCGAYAAVAGTLGVDGAARCGLSCSLSCRLSPSVSGQLTCKLGASSAVQAQLVRDSQRWRLRGVAQLGLPHSHVSGHVTVKLPARDASVRGTCKMSTTGGVHVELALDHALSSLSAKHGDDSDDDERENDESSSSPPPDVSAVDSSLSLAVSAAVVGGVSVRVRLTRAGQQYQLVARLSDEVAASAVLYGVCVPLLVTAAVKKLLLEPMSTRSRQQRREARQQADLQRVRRRREEATAAVTLMKETVARVIRQEQQSEGLLVTSAWYGPEHCLPSLNDDNYDDDENPPHDDQLADVTVPLQCLVRRSQLMLPVGDRRQLPGFCDLSRPRDGSRSRASERRLLVLYSYRGRTHRAMFADNELVLLPRDSHRVT